MEDTAFKALVREKAAIVELSEGFLSRPVNSGFSGGEKKRNEIMQMLLLNPRFAVLDETDSGLDIDSLRTVATGVNSMRGSETAVLLITHYQRLLNYIAPDFVHVFQNGRIVLSGGPVLALRSTSFSVQIGYAQTSWPSWRIGMKALTSTTPTQGT
jgi:Fe-S cluster assembly ATP-binding protein